MLLTALLPALLSSLPPTSSLPTTTRDLYQCGYVLTIHNSSAYAGLSAYDACAPFFYNDTISDYQEAFAYGLYGGCGCSFYVTVDACENPQDEPLLSEPTEIGKEPRFADPKPKWYNCYRDE